VALKEVHRIGGEICILSEEEQLIQLNKKTIGAKLSSLFLTTPLAEPIMYDTPNGKVFTRVNQSVTTLIQEIAGRTAILISGGDSSISFVRTYLNANENPEENPIILSAYQEYVKSYGKEISDIAEIKQEIISIKKDEYGKTVEQYIYLDQNPDEFRKEIRSSWEEIIAKRMENEDFDVDSVAKSFSKSNQLIKLR
jgi:hypothetical protein